jgi:S1-C subfamily serine protease
MRVRTVVILLGLLGLLASVSALKKVCDNQAVFQKISSSVVSIFSVRPFEGFGGCSGVVVKETDQNTYVLTCKHCLANAIEETYVERSRVQGYITRTDDDLAIAVVEGKVESKHPVVLAKQNAAIHDEVYHTGFPDGIENAYSKKGKVIRYTKDWGWSTVKAIPGCSGGGYFNKEGQLIGIIWGGMDMGGEISMFTPIDHIQKFLSKVDPLLK